MLGVSKLIKPSLKALTSAILMSSPKMTNMFGLPAVGPAAVDCFACAKQHVVVPNGKNRYDKRGQGDGVQIQNFRFHVSFSFIPKLLPDLLITLQRNTKRTRWRISFS
jgi:hypothetical protein